MKGPFMRNLAAFLTLVAGLATTSPALAEPLPFAAPEEIGLSSERLARITERLKADSAEGTIPGAVLLVARHGKIGHFEAVGVLDPESKAPMTQDAIFRIYSMSKPITQVAAMMLHEEGRIALGQPISKYIPAFADTKVGVEKPGAAGVKPTLELEAVKRPISIQDLMRHSSGITYGFFGDTLVKTAYREAGVTKGDFTNAEFAERIARLPLGSQPGTNWDYSHSTDILGRLIEIADGKPLSEALRARLLGPLGMQDTGFYVTDTAKQKRIAEPFANDRSLGVDAPVFDPREAKKWESAGGGLMGTTMDYARFLQMLLNGGELDGRRYLSPATIAYMTSDHLGSTVGHGKYYLPEPGYTFGLGFAVRQEAGVAPFSGSPGDYYWGGAGGTYFWVDPKQDMFAVFMMQSPKQRVPYRSLIRDMVYAAVMK